jgi:hypothetical protein
MKRIKSLYLLVLIGAPMAWAGPGASGGGNAVVCFDDPGIPAAIRNPNSGRSGQILDDEVKNHITSVEAFDLYEARMVRGLTSASEPKLIPIEANDTPRDYAEKLAKRFELYIPSLSDTIRSGTRALTDANILQRPSGLTRINDEADVGYIDSENCVVATMAAQYETGDTTFLQIDSRLYNHKLHTQISRAVLFLHEAIYFSARNGFVKQTDSRNTRTLVGAIIKQDPIDSAWLVDLYKKLNMPYNTRWVAYIANWFEDQSYDMKKSVEAQVASLASTKENLALIERFNRWVSKYSPRIGDLFNDDRDFAEKVDSRIPVIFFVQDYERKDLLCSKTWTKEGCLAEYQALLSLSDVWKKRVSDIEQQAVSSYFNTRTFPQIETLMQYDHSTRTDFEMLLSPFGNQLIFENNFDGKEVISSKSFEKAISDFAAKLEGVHFEIR